MKRYRGIAGVGIGLALALAGVSVGGAIDPTDLSEPSGEPSGDERAAMAATQELCVAFRSGDVASAERLLAPEFTLVSSDSSIQSRGEALAEIRAGEPRYELFENVDMTARVYGDLAMIRGVTRLRGTSEGTPFELDVRFTDLLVRSEGGWRIVTSHVTRIPAPRVPEP